MATTEFEDVTLRLPKGLGERVLAEAAEWEITDTLSEITAEALERWIASS